MNTTERLDQYEARLSDPMVTYKENATEDVPALVNALRAVLAWSDAVQAELDKGVIFTPDARYCWNIAVREVRGAIEGALR